MKDNKQNFAKAAKNVVKKIATSLESSFGDFGAERAARLIELKQKLQDSANNQNLGDFQDIYKAYISTIDKITKKLMATPDEELYKEHTEVLKALISFETSIESFTKTTKLVNKQLSKHNIKTEKLNHGIITSGLFRAKRSM